MSLLDEIRESLGMISKNKSLPIRSLEADNEAWVVRENDWFGVAIRNKYDVEISESFSSARIWSDVYNVGGHEIPLIFLTSRDERLQYEFASICAEFCDPGCDNQRREILQKDPFSWWETWRNLLGNAIHIKKPYSVLGEMICFEYLVKSGKTVIWSALAKATHDLVTMDESYEVKSTVKRYESTMTINSQYQLKEDSKPLNLFFCRFEPSPHGTNIDELFDKLVKHGIDEYMLEDGLSSMGVERGSRARATRYKLLELRSYVVDSHFPQINAGVFINKKIPENITKITYEIDLNGLSFKTVNI